MNKLLNVINTTIQYTFLFFTIGIILLLLMRCSSPQPKADTMKHEIEVATVQKDIDLSIDCKTDDCKKTVVKVKQVLADGLELSKEKDAQIDKLTQENNSLGEKAKKYDRLVFIFWALIISALLAVLGSIIWKYRVPIMRLLGIPAY